MKVSIVGIGKVGTALGLTLVARGLIDELVLIGRPAATPGEPTSATGEAMDLLHASAFTRPAEVRAGVVADATGSDVIVICASDRTPTSFLNRNDSACANAALFRKLLPPLISACPAAILLVTTNPPDALTTLALQLSNLPSGRVLGTGTLLDTMRLRVLLSRRCGIHPRDIRAYVLGEHGDTQFVAYSSASAGGSRIELDPSLLRALEAQARLAGHEIVRQKGHSCAGVALAAAAIIEAIATDSREIIPVSTLVNGFAGVNGVCLSLPAVIGRAGVLRTLDIELAPLELDAFRRSAEAVQETLNNFPPAQDHQPRGVL
jgi:L-lactate dehydrogenase